MRGMKEEAEEKPDAALHEELQTMEAKVRKLRETRNSFSDSAKQSADKRNSIQAQFKEHREKSALVLSEVKVIRAEIKLFKEKRNAIQDQLRQLFSQAKGRRGEKNEKRSATAEFMQLKQEIDNLETTFETSSVGPKKEREMMANLKLKHRRLAELEPEVAQFDMVSIDLSDLDGSIKILKSEADAAHKAMIEAVVRVTEKSKELDEVFAHRDFLKAEGDRFHEEYLDFRKKADEMHEKTVELMKDVDKARDQLHMAKKERASWITDHNKSVKSEMSTGASSADVADGMVSSLLSSGVLKIGGTGSGDSDGSTRPAAGKSSKKAGMRRINMQNRRR